MPKLEKMSSEEHVSISKKMFYGGFAFLPFLWLVNFLYFFNTSRQANAPKALKKCKNSRKKKII
jgi:presenilin enhancer 2